MEINKPFIFRELNSRTMKKENNKNKREKNKIGLFQNIKNIWNDEVKVRNQISPLKNKKNIMLINYTEDQKQKQKKENLGNTLYARRNKKDIFEDNYFIEKFKQKKIKYSFPINKDNPDKNGNFYLNNLYFGFNTTSKENNKSPLITASTLPDNNNNKNIPQIEDKNIYNKLNVCFENYININDNAIEEIIKHQKRILLSTTINTPKFIQKKDNSNLIDKKNNSLSKIIDIRPIKTNFNGILDNSNKLHNRQKYLNKLTNSFTDENMLKSGQANKIVLPNLSINPYIIRNKNKLSQTTLDKENNLVINERYNSEAKKSLKSIKIKRNINLFPSSKKLLDNEKTSLFSTNTSSNKNKKTKIEFNSKLKTIIYEAPPPDYYTSNFNYYIVFPNNCGWLIKKCLAHRINWKECHSKFTNFFNFKWKDVVCRRDFYDLGSKNTRIQIINHYEFHSCLSNKSNMFYNLSKYCETINDDVFKYVPFTVCFDCMNFDEFNIYKDNFKEIFSNINNYIFNNNSINNQLYNRNKIPYRDLFPLDNKKIGQKFYCEIPKSHFAGKNLWIVKAPNLNRGRCIKVFDNFNNIIKFLNEMRKGNVNQYDNIKEKGNKDDIIKEEISERKEENNKVENINNNSDKKETLNNKDNDNGNYQSNIIILQKYIEKPFLYKGRKFDIRIWVLINHKMEIYMFKEGHLKASSVNYSIDDNNSFIHLTNYSLQKHNKNFSKYELGNEISFDIFQKFLDTLGDKSFNFREKIIPKFKTIIELTTKAAKTVINQCKKNYCFEIFGYDFMMDEDLNIYLIEINTNPGLEISSKIIEILIPRMIDDALRLTIDELFETKYKEEWMDKDMNYKSNYHVDGYDDKENMWEFICNINKNNEKYICEDYYGYGYVKNKKKKKHTKKG